MDLHESPSAGVVVETVLLGMRDGRLTCRLDEARLADGDHPDALARRLAGFTESSAIPGRMVHSTSWRFDAGRIVLTYAALPDPDPRTAVFHEAPVETARGADPMSPSPEYVGHADVIAHACRHLAFLRRTDPVAATAAEQVGGLWELLDEYAPDVAGQRTNG
ncbi:hypothetical protein [Actinoplanes sp. NPDC051851]|uniref:hypothetical protein n=1 Tax=Actinoplanes sp. NPDC051851 TaxID=3154753 RepID=UPI0034490ABD